MSKVAAEFALPLYSLSAISAAVDARQIIAKQQAAKNQFASLSQSVSQVCSRSECVKIHSITEPQLFSAWVIEWECVCVQCIWHNLVRGYRVHNEGAAGVSRYDGMDDTKAAARGPMGRRRQLIPSLDMITPQIYCTGALPCSQSAGGRTAWLLWSAGRRSIYLPSRFAHYPLPHTHASLFLSTACSHVIGSAIYFHAWIVWQYS
jgi:hypothetical protein